MSTSNIPFNVFKLATVRASRTPIIADANARRIAYSSGSTFHTTLKANRAGANPRAAMVTSATAFKNSNPLHIASAAALKALFPGFDRVDDYLRTHQKSAVKADLKTLVEGTLVLNQTASAYVAGGGYAALKSRVWDNVFALTVLGERAALRTEEVRIIRLLNVIEKIASNDVLLDTGAGIFSAYLSTVLLPNDVFPMPDVALPTEPVTQPAPPDTITGLKTQLATVQAAYTQIMELYDRQCYRYRKLRYPIRDETDPDDSKQTNHIVHDPLALNDEMVSKLSAGTLTELAKQQIGTDFVYMPQVHERFGGEIRRLGRAVEAARERQTVVRVGGALIMLGNECVSPQLESPCKPFIFEQWPGGAGHLKPLGVADLKVVQTQLYKYEQGEVAHVENILQGEVRKRTFRDLSRTEITTEQEQETYTENEKETQTTERFELHKEASNVLQENQASQAGATVTARYGTVSGTVSGSISSSTSQMQANAQATSYAKEVMDRALERVIEKTRTKRTVTTIVENEQTTEHTFDNTTDGAGGTDNIAGVYRWLDKVYYNKVVNYGRRMVFEFVVPEPAAFYLFSKLAKPKSNEVIEAPPPFTIHSFEDINPQTYDGYAVLYGAIGIKPPPTTIQTVQWARDFWPGPGDTATKTFKETITVPEGFVATSVKVTFLITSAANHYITVSVGGSAALTRYSSDLPVDIFDLPQATGGELPIIIKAVCMHWAASFVIYCKPTTETYQQWQIDTFAALKTAYDQKLSEYNRWLNEESANASTSGNNPGANRQTERQELKKHCIEFITGQRFESFDALRPNVAPFGYPEFSFDEATTEGKYIQFFEQAFEWEQMTYLFYPYYWARKKEWVNILQRDESDPLFMKFLQAGAARVQVPVRNEYVKAVLHYLNTGGEIWNGEDVPMPDDAMYVSIVEEIMEADGYFEGGEVEGEPWLSKVPTSLVYLTHEGSPNDLPNFSAELPL